MKPNPPSTEYWRSLLRMGLLCGLLIGIPGLCANSTDAGARSTDTAPDATALSLRGWYSRRYEIAPVLTRLWPRPQSTTRPGGIPLKVNFPEATEAFTKITVPFAGYEYLELVLQIPEDFPADGRVYVFVKDWDDLWLHLPINLPADRRGTVTIRAPLSGTEAKQKWRPRGHHRPWHQLMGSQLSEFGIKISPARGSATTWKGSLHLQSVRLLQADQKESFEVRNVHLAPQQARVGRPIEMAFEVTHPFRDAYDREDVDLKAEITLPDGTTNTVACFYYEDFLFDPQDLFAKPVAYGAPQFRLRYTPKAPGSYRIRVAGHLGEQAVQLPTAQVVVAPDKAWRGYIRRSEDDFRFLVYSRDGSEFWGQGLNVRSPSDNRYQQVFPFCSWEDYNLNIYKRLFKKYKEAGINVVEVWLSSWWLALEWIPDAPGNHGIGQFNQRRAWQLDQLLRWAEENDIYVILAINNHGKFSTWCDQEWHRNPYNISRGGYLRRPESFFTHKRAKADFRKLADYLIARWGYSSHLLAWKLFTEINLTGGNREWYRYPPVTRWHRDAATYFKQQDPNRHLVTTHWSGNYSKAQESPQLSRLPELDVLTLDAYYGEQKGTRRLYDTLDGTMRFQDGVKKPCLITEYGGSAFADSLPHILQQLHIAQWKGFFGGFPTSPCLWWFPLVEERDLYGEYRALAAFAKGESRIGAKTTQRRLTGGLQQCELRRGNQGLAWVFDRSYFFDNNLLQTVAGEHQDRVLSLSGFNSGEYVVEFWNCRTGQVIGTKELSFAGSGSLRVPLPAFRRDIALKIKPVNLSE